MKTIMIVDDQLNVRTLVRDVLTAEGFRVVEAANGRQGLIVARRERPDLILLDVMMPEMGGYDFIRAYQKEGAAPIIVLTAKQEESDKVLGLELGADDYITKPFGMRELVARIRAVLRRTEAEDQIATILREGQLQLDRESHQVALAGQFVNLTPSEFELLGMLMSAPGRVFSRAQLLERLQGEESERVERTIDVHIKNLRAKIEADPAAPQYIETVFGVGYRFRAHPAESQAD